MLRSSGIASARIVSATVANATPSASTSEKSRSTAGNRGIGANFCSRLRRFNARKQRLESQFRDKNLLAQLELICNPPRELACDAFDERRAVVLATVPPLRQPCRASAREPCRPARLPRKSSSERADAVEVALQIREAEFARRFVNRLLARQAGCAQRQHRRLDRLAVPQLVRLADFKQAQIALPVIQIPLQSAQHAHDSGRAHHRRIFRQRVADHRGRHALRAEKFVAARIHQRNRHNFLIAERNHSLAQPILRLGVRQTMRRLLCRRQPRRELVVSVVPRDLFDQIDSARGVAPPRRLLAFPNCQQRAGASRDASPSARDENRARSEFPRYRGPARPRPSRAEVPSAKPRLPGPPRGPDRRPRRPLEFRPRPIAESARRRGARPAPPSPDRAALEPVRRLGPQAERLRSSAHGDRIEPR